MNLYFPLTRLHQLSQTLFLLDKQVLIHLDQAISISHQATEVLVVAFRKNLTRLDVIWKRPGYVKGGMWRYNLFRRAILCIEVN